jgi:hypothetical protein
MRTLRIFLFAVALLSTVSVRAQNLMNPYFLFRDYFVSTSGSGDGSSPANAASVATFETDLPGFSERTHVYFKRGDTFALDDLVVPASNLQFAAYGSGADPIISGSEDLSAATWTSEAGGYYSTPMATAPKWIFIDGEAARQGESNWIVITSAPSGTSRGALTATLNAFNSVQSLVGAKLRVKEFLFRYSHEHNISAYNSGTGVITTTETFVGASTGLPFKLYGQKQFATAQNDWWWDDASDKLWIKKSTSPSGTDIRVSYSDRAFSVTSKSGVSFTGLEFKHYYLEAIYSSVANNLLIEDCNIHDIRTNGIKGLGASTDVVIQNNTITRCGFNGISFGIWEDFQIINNSISYIGEQANLGWPIEAYPFGTSGVAIFSGWESGTAPQRGYVYRNTLYHLGYQGYMCCGNDHIAEENFIDTYNTKWTDGGAIHTFHRSDLGVSTRYCTFRKNIIVNAIGSLDGVPTNPSYPMVNAGIYIDNGSAFMTIDQNTIIGALNGVLSTSNYGVFLNIGTSSHTITNNTIYNHSRACVQFAQDNTISALDPDFINNSINNTLTGNILIAASLVHYCVISEDHNGSSSYNPFSGTGNSDNNSYMSLYGTAVNGYATSHTGSVTTQTLAQWRTKFSDDAGSNAIVTTLIGADAFVRDAAEMVVNYNETLATENISIGANYVDHLNATISGSTDIAPFESVAYFSTVNRSYLIDNFTAANGTSLTGRAPDFGPTPVIVSGTHTVSSNRMVTSSNGLVSYNLGTGINDYVWECFTDVTNVAATMPMHVRLGDDIGSANNRIILDFTGGNIRLREFYASATATQTLTTAFTVATSTNYVIKLYCSGATIKAYVNDVLYLTMTTSLTTGNRVGISGETTRRTDKVVAYDDAYFTP